MHFHVHVRSFLFRRNINISTSFGLPKINFRSKHSLVFQLFVDYNPQFRVRLGLQRIQILFVPVLGADTLLQYCLVNNRAGIGERRAHRAMPVNYARL